MNFILAYSLYVILVGIKDFIFFFIISLAFLMILSRYTVKFSYKKTPKGAFF